jgi:hypothetical protein
MNLTVCSADPFSTPLPSVMLDLNAFIAKLSKALTDSICTGFVLLLRRTKEHVGYIVVQLFALDVHTESDAVDLASICQRPAAFLFFHEHINFKRKLEDACRHATESLRQECSKLPEYLKELARRPLGDLFDNAYKQTGLNERLRVLQGAFWDGDLGEELLGELKGRVVNIVDRAYNEFKSCVDNAGKSLVEVLRLHSKPQLRGFVVQVREQARQDRSAATSIARCALHVDHADRLVAFIQEHFKDPGHAAIQNVCKDYAAHAVSPELRAVLQGTRVAANDGVAPTATRRCNQCGLCRRSFVRTMTQLYLNIPVCSDCHAKVQTSASTETCAFCRLEGPTTRCKQPDREKPPKDVEWLRCSKKSCKPKFCADCIKFLSGPIAYEKAKQKKWQCFACCNESHVAAIAPARKEEVSGMQVLSLFDGIAGGAVALRR